MRFVWAVRRQLEELEGCEAMIFRLKLILLIILVIASGNLCAAMQQPSLNETQASHFARLALKCVQKEYPNKPDHTINDASDVRGPRAMHPAVYGCFDWHSIVHAH